jgi:hypothetical protein
MLKQLACQTHLKFFHAFWNTLYNHVPTYLPQIIFRSQSYGGTFLAARTKNSAKIDRK